MLCSSRIRPHRSALFAAVLFLAPAVSLVSSRRADAQERTPQQVLAAFVATLNAGKPDCSLMVADLLEEFVSPLLVHQPPFAPRPLTTADRLASCRSVLTAERSEAAVVRTSIVRATVAERTSTLARLRVRVRQDFGSGDRVYQRVAQRVDVWMELEDRAWKLVTRDYLVPSSEGSPMPPGDLKQWPAYREWLTTRATEHRAEQEHRVTAARQSTRAVAAQPLACDGRSSHATDPTRDVEWSSGGDLVPDQRRPTIDMQAASLHSQAGSFCWEVRFTHPPGPSYELGASVSRRSRKPGPRNVQPVDFRQEVWIHVQNGTVLGGVEAKDGALDLFPVELSQTGTLVRLKLTRGDLFHRAGPFDGRHSFRWELGSFEDNPTGADDYSNWTDRLVGVPHRP